MLLKSELEGVIMEVLKREKEEKTEFFEQLDTLQREGKANIDCEV